MNLTDMRCALKFLGWENKVKRRESVWRDKQGNFILFEDHQIVLRINNNITRHSYIGTDLQSLMNLIMETVEDKHSSISNRIDNGEWGL